MENRIYVSIPLDALIVSGITSDCAVQISAMDGAILIERCDDDCEDRAERRNPERDLRGHVQCEDHSGNDGGEVRDGHGLLHAFLPEELGDHGGCDGDDHHQQRADAELHDAVSGGGQHGDADILHDPSGIILIPYMRGRRDVQHFHFFASSFPFSAASAAAFALASASALAFAAASSFRLISA